MNTLNRKKSFVIKENEYEVSFPKVGEFLKMESLKASLSQGNYGSFINAMTMSSVQALDFIDMLALYQVLCPKLIKDIKLDNILEMDALDAKELLAVYKKEIQPWINEWLKLFQNPTEDKKE